MKPRRLLAALLLALLAVGLAPPAAYAGGPTSLLMSNPDQQRVAAAYYDDPAYQAVGDAVGEGQTGPAAPPAGLATGGGEDVRLTWLIHDVQVWRVDRIHLTSADGIWVETVVSLDDGDIWDAAAHWHRPHDEAALLAALSTAGLIGDSAAPGETPAGAPAGTPAEATVLPPADPVPGLLVAVLAGLALGVAGTLAGRRLRSATTAGSGPRVTLSG